jgi:hypothetical protein
MRYSWEISVRKHEIKKSLRNLDVDGVTADLKKREFVMLTRFVSHSIGDKLQYYMKKTFTCYMLLYSQELLCFMSWLTAECMGHQSPCLRLLIALTLKQRTVLSAQFNYRGLLVPVIKTTLF